MHGAIPTLLNTPSWRGAQLSAQTTLPLPLTCLNLTFKQFILPHQVLSGAYFDSLFH
jgi:hypothetical protein